MAALDQEGECLGEHSASGVLPPQPMPARRPGTVARMGKDDVNDPVLLYISRAEKLCFTRTITPNFDRSDCLLLPSSESSGTHSVIRLSAKLAQSA
jgi:hypothetical protein